ncbi:MULTISPECIES: diacylglycerol/lipid kinase family protein [unclassified Cryobacterium]|uniref:diacylglycerol/lipid kinase family protein n=1 Tax=unclassified Cryobacterium TaxID=2649013 RepID=UPI0018C93763|nr:diacylglycerol kinase family protein [Cryobacterium sp. CAN_C3]
MIYHPIGVDRKAITSAIAVEEKAPGWNPTRYCPTIEEDAGPGALRPAQRAEADMVIVAGGDGTVPAIKEVVQDRDATLALVPSGARNLFARNLNLALDDTARSIHTAFNRVDRPVDVGPVDVGPVHVGLIESRHGDETLTNHAFLIMAGLGLHAKMTVNTDENFKKTVGWLAYLSVITNGAHSS